MAVAVRMTVVDGVRYRIEDAPDRTETVDEPTADPSVKQRKKVQDKARTTDSVQNKK